MDQTSLALQSNRIEEQFSRLLSRFKQTKGARFQASRRHKKRSRASIWSIVFLSLYVFSISVVLVIFSENLTQTEGKILNFFNILMSAFILALSAIEHGKRHDLRAEMFLKCAQGVSDLQDQVQIDIATFNQTPEILKDRIDAYQRLITNFSDNHSNMDFQTYRISVGKDSMTSVLRVFYSAIYFWNCWSISILSIVLPPCMLFLVFYRAVPAA